jgi:hypothetical protein
MKKTILSLSLFFMVSTVFSQSFMHGAGINYLVRTSNAGGGYFAYGFTYSPRFNFLENEKLSISVGLPLTIAMSIGFNGYLTSINYGTVVNAPLIFNLNMGRGSTMENRNKFGYFFGGGMAFHHGDLIGGFPDFETGSENAFGPAANTGMRFGVGKKHKNIEVRFSYMKGLNENKPDIIGVGCLFNF